MNAADLTEGQRVWLYDIKASRRHGSGGPTEATVEKVGRKLVTIRPVDSNWTQVFRIEEQRVNDDYGHQWFKTDAQREEGERIHFATSTLREAGLDVAYRAAFTVDDLERLVAALPKEKN